MTGIDADAKNSGSVTVSVGKNLAVTASGDGDATGIVDHNRETITNNRWYTVDGKTIDQQPTVKGMYIHNGPVVVIK